VGFIFFILKKRHFNIIDYMRFLAHDGPRPVPNVSGTQVPGVPAGLEAYRSREPRWIQGGDHPRAAAISNGDLSRTAQR
jgi:hypothetical protein